ncbi:hypothetical protein A2707_06005 [Candidatus Saccharibacteria bacterium RIFCSPHIGHO2_01_FULL_45_15]|nr:MAG: hypothetical protein A2707_06005 [Candidatus Saccharibacteria bacterium RIFCSPHIGHO2_01_FULL_45_15]OGL28998.1 MAG: hypothetical protein A3C39_06230 [Candidatus Saccharibacteria bacterium RIFCSPHIGHO2_02_FULL_46_12]
MLMVFSLNIQDSEQSHQSGELLGFFGNILGGIIGVIGAVSVALLAYRLERQHELKVEEQKKIGEYHRTIQAAEVVLQDQIGVLSMNARVLPQCRRNLESGTSFLNMPNTVDVEMGLLRRFRNIELANKWLKYSMQAKIFDKQLKEFTVFYLDTAKAIHMLSLESKKIDQDIVHHDYAVLASFAREVEQANEILLKETRSLFTYVVCHARLKDHYFKSLEEVNEYSVSESSYAATLHEVNERFTLDKMFTELPLTES